MGGLHEDYGPNQISVETRRESFIIHAGYGLVPAKRKLSDLRPGTDFLLEDRHWRLRTISETMAAAQCNQTSVYRDWPLDTLVEVPDEEPDFDESAPLAKRWAEDPHPEFDADDVEHLISALCHVPTCPSGVRKVMGVNVDGS